MDDAMSYAFRLELGGHTDEAAGSFEELLQRDLPHQERALILKHLGNLHMRMGHLRKAAVHLRDACKLEPLHGAFWHDRGLVEYHMADFDAAVASFRQALDVDPQQLLAHFWLGQALYHGGQMEAAVDEFRELLTRFPNFAIARFHLGVVLERLGRSDEAGGEFRRVLAKNPRDAAASHYVEPDASH